MQLRATPFERHVAGTAVRGATPGVESRTGPTRIIFVVNAAWFFLSHRLPIALAARDAGYEVHLLTDVGTAAEQQTLDAAGIIVHRAPLTRASLNPVADLGFVWHLVRVLREVSPVLVHNVTVKPVLYGTFAARILGIPAIINAFPGLGYAFSDRSRWMLASAIRSAYRLVLRSPRVHLIFQNDDDAREFAAAGLASPGQSTLIRGSGVDLTTFHPAPEDTATPPLIVLAGRMLRDKGVVEFVAAARLLGERGCRARFALAGPLDPFNPAALSEHELSELTAGSGVTWLGQVRNMAELYRRAHIVCLPSYREGLPMSLLEACAAGRPIVTTDVPGCRAVVTHGVNGLLVPVRDPHALADALQRLTDDAELRVRLGAAGRARAEADFAVGSVIAQTLGLYARALAGS